MTRCKICKVPLNGFLSAIGKAFFNIRRSSIDPEICNKCAAKGKEDNVKNNNIISDDKTYQCQICSRVIHSEHAIEHIKAEEYLINLIKKDHPKWQHKGTTCQECIQYYRKLIKDAEI